MRKLILLFLPLLYSCNNEIATNISPEDKKAPDYNLLLEAPVYFPWDSARSVYSSTAVVYLRPFENVRDIDKVTLQFDSNNLARFILMGDTLYNKDKKTISYSDFSKYFLNFGYESQISGQHRVSITTTIKSVSKQSEMTFNTPNL